MCVIEANISGVPYYVKIHDLNMINRTHGALEYCGIIENATQFANQYAAEKAIDIINYMCRFSLTTKCKINGK